MPNITRYRVEDTTMRHRGRRFAGHPGYHHCSYRCPDCGPDAEAWAVGEAITGLLVAVGALVGWMFRHPVTVLIVAVIATVTTLAV